MGTFLSLHIKATNQSHVTKILQELSDADEMTIGAYPKDFYESILMDDKADPTLIAIGNVHEGWIYVHINSFKKLHKWAKTISEDLNTSVIQVLGQTVSDAYYFLMYEKGQLRREIDIYHGDFDITIDKGEKFSFEPISLIPENEEDYENLFDIETISSYCRALGFDLYQDTHEQTFILLTKKNSTPTLKQSIIGSKKPWWKFW